MVKSKTLAALAISASLMGSAFYGAPSYAAMENNSGAGSSLINLGALVGIGFLNNNLGNQLVFGVDGGYKVMPNIMVGGYATYNSISQIAGLSSSLFTVAPEASYVLDSSAGVLNGLRVGAKMGLGFASTGGGSVTVAGTTVSAPSTSSTSFVVGPHVAYDYPLMPSVTLGGEGNYLIYTSNGGFNAFNLLGALKYWF